MIYSPEPWKQSSLASAYVLDKNDEVVCALGEYTDDGHLDGMFTNAQWNIVLILAAPKLLRLLKRYVANDHVHGGCDELTEEAETLLENLDSGTRK